MSTDPRIEAAAEVLCEQLWDNAHERQRQRAREDAEDALAAADAVDPLRTAKASSMSAPVNSSQPGSPARWTRGMQADIERAAEEVCRYLVTADEHYAPAIVRAVVDALREVTE